MYPSIFSDETNSSRSIIIPHINPPEIVSLPSLWREKKKEREKETDPVCIRLRARTYAHTRTLALWRPGPLTHWLIRHKREARRGSFSSSAESRLVEKKSGASTSNFSLFVPLVPTVIASQLHQWSRSRLCNRARGISENPFVLSRVVR